MTECSKPLDFEKKRILCGLSAADTASAVASRAERVRRRNMAFWGCELGAHSRAGNAPCRAAQSTRIAVRAAVVQSSRLMNRSLCRFAAVAAALLVAAGCRKKDADAD